jgi:hypothetical protein
LGPDLGANATYPCLALAAHSSYRNKKIAMKWCICILKFRYDIEFLFKIFLLQANIASTTKRYVCMYVCVYACKWWSGWPDKAKFRPLGNRSFQTFCLLQKWPTSIFGLPRYFIALLRYLLTNDKKFIGLHFGRFFHKLIWSIWWWFPKFKLCILFNGIDCSPLSTLYSLRHLKKEICF